MKLASKTDLIFEPGESDAIPLDATGDQYTTPATHRATLGYLAVSRIVAGKVRARLRMSGAATQGDGTVELRDGQGNVLGSAAVDFSTGDTRYDVEFTPDLSGLGFGSQMSLVLAVANAADASTTATLAGALAVDVPLIDC